MRRVARITGLLALIGSVSLSCADDNQSTSTPTPQPTMSINDLMITVIAPATDTIWGIEDPQTDAEWQVFIDAAEKIMSAGEVVKAGGTGPSDNDWAADPAWQAFADRLIEAAQLAKDAAGNKSVDDMYTAGEVLYPPCEECHIQFHPGVSGYQ